MSKTQNAYEEMGVPVSIEALRAELKAAQGDIPQLTRERDAYKERAEVAERHLSAAEAHERLLARVKAERDAEIARQREELCWTQAVVVEERYELDRMRKALEDAPHEEDCEYILSLQASLLTRPHGPVKPCNCWKSSALNQQPAQQETICGFPVVISNKLASPEDKGQSVVFGPVPQGEK